MNFLKKFKAFLLLGATTLVFLVSPAGKPIVTYAQSQGCNIINGVTRCSAIQLSTPAITPSAAAGVTVNDMGQLTELVYKVTVPASAFVCAAVTCDVTIATLPAKTFVAHAIVDQTAVFACTAVCTSTTLSYTLGKTAGGNQYLVSVDADAATGQFGDAAAELGASLTPATVPTLNGDLASWSTTTPIVLRMTSGTGNIGNATVTNFSTGSLTFYLTTVKMP